MGKILFRFERFVNDKYTKFDRSSLKPPSYLSFLRQRGSSRQHRLLSEHSRIKAKCLPKKDSFYYYERMSTAHKELYNLDTPYRNSKASGVFLDAGCGNSPDALIARLCGYNKAYKIDLFAPTYNADFTKMTKYGWSKLNFAAEERRQGVEFIQGDICDKQPLNDVSVDTIICSAVLDLMPASDRLYFYKEAYRLLKPGGFLSINLIYLRNGYGGLDGELRRALTVGFECIRHRPKWNVMRFVLRKSVQPYDEDEDRFVKNNVTHDSPKEQA